MLGQTTGDAFGRVRYGPKLPMRGPERITVLRDPGLLMIGKFWPLGDPLEALGSLN